ncbi:LuxR C-terminal-related transcriptional regulator [Aeromicrobium sp. IC_218]|uniref:helix-turn-helix transcriptional regulator n=1 Tax=Aeromicrobium sp. IC_218 TaxID=2545468 RepID=UPI00103D400F|nr:LuxR C-terminal-related transcriptional regulator [Aeromicrobium sp. IC_218]TCI97620.1 hypothetical protein E0W78_11245 [Aeromicrobium sp. IC_218]
MSQSHDRPAARLPARLGGDPPRLPRTYLQRTALFERLDVATQGPLTMLVAPAGTGKTLGAGGWARLRHDGPVAWVQADSRWDAQRLGALLDLAAGDPSPRLVVVDDAHLLPHDALTLVERRLSQSPHDLRVLLLSRWDLPLRRLVPELLGHLTVLRGDVLSLADDEVAVLVAEHARTPAPEVARAVAEQAQGWCAAVVLISRTIATSAVPATAARRLASGDGGIAGRVTSEVFASLPPRERHLLLSVASEQLVTTDLAAHLSHDPDAGELLSHLELTGMLVTRVDGASLDGPFAPDSDARFRIHPLLVEVIRRRLVAGGVDVQRARATVARAVALDVARGDAQEAFGRLVAVHDDESAVRLLAQEGISLLMRGHGAAIASFVRDHTDVVEAEPDAWLAVLLERWVAGDVDAARRWAERLSRRASTGDAAPSTGPTRVLTSAFVGLVRARLGLADLDEAVVQAKRVADRMVATPGGPADHAALPQLLAELGITQNWTGDLAAAEQNLTAAVELGRRRDLPALTLAATTHLALTQYMRGCERGCVEIAQDADRLLSGAGSWQPRFARTRADLASLLARLPGLPWPEPPVVDGDTGAHAHPADLATRFWLRVRDARVAMRAGAVHEAQRLLTTPWNLPGPALPQHLRVVVLVERAFLAYLSGDLRGLRELEDELREVDAPGEHQLVRGLRADLDGDRRAAAAAYRLAVSSARYPQPATRELALTCLAQVLDVLGDHDEALDRLREAVVATAVRNNAAPFLGWSRHGSPLSPLLEDLALHDVPPPGSWLDQVLTARRDQPDLAAAYAPTVATSVERERVSTPAARLALSARERDVLTELARGSTYADVAANLVVSENTVKTHVSNLYAKLSVSSRSEALAVARTLHLL